MTGRDRTDDILATFDQMNGKSTPTAADQRVTDALEGRDPFKDAADARIIAALDGPHAVREANALWMEHSEVNMAAGAYAQARLRAMPNTKTLAEAQQEADWERNRYMAKHRNDHADEAALLEATATHLTNLAAVHNRPASNASVKLPEAWRKTPGKTVTASRGPQGPGPSPVMTRLYQCMDHYRDSIMRDSSREAFRDAAQRTAEIRRAFMAENRSKYPTEAALQTATAEHFTNLALGKA